MHVQSAWEGYAACLPTASKHMCVVNCGQGFLSALHKRRSLTDMLSSAATMMASPEQL